MPMPYSVKALKRLAGMNKNGRERRWSRGAPGLMDRSPAMSPTPDYFFLSVAQPPLPLQEFLPLQPLSPVLQPPLPLQEFCPEQPCFSTFLSAKDVPADCPARDFAEVTPTGELPGTTTPGFRRVIVPPRRPVKAAVNTKELFE